MFEKEIQKYARLNELTRPGATVLFGSGADTDLPIAEIASTMDTDMKFYNRSIGEISVTDAAAYYTAVIVPIAPSRIILHIGQTDIDLFTKSSADFAGAYRSLIHHIRAENKKCSIGFLSLQSSTEDSTIAEMNRCIQKIADAESCEFADILQSGVWNPSATRDALAFASAMGLTRTVKNNKSLYDLARMIYGCRAM